MSTPREELRSAVLWISSSTDELVMPAHRRARLALSCLWLAVEHQAAISLLSERSLWGPAYALLKCLLDALVRGVWLARCASDHDLDTFELAGLRRKSFDDMAAEVERALGHSRGALSKLSHSSWAIFSESTDAGSEDQRRRRYPSAETDHALRLATALGLLAATEIADLSGHRNVAIACRERAIKSASAPHP